MKNAIIYVHGQGGNYLEAGSYKKNCPNFDMYGVDYNTYLPWVVKKEIIKVYDKVRSEYERVYVIANSIGAYFSMYALQNFYIEKALFISPVLDMESLILDMMNWSNISEKELYEKKEIKTNIGEVISWDYLHFVRENHFKWDIPTKILYAERDELISRQTIDDFQKKHNVGLTIMHGGEHWFHTERQIDYLNDWMKRSMS
ncbi:alpha/beta hydrolase [Lactiplantibacillus plantarum]|uniref:alpha/beta hydrolase n=1 Tax=Lactiplantibacillus plantarum TaxID=1590 RepID=UPI0025520950|nr:alpha/beta hydrolase [Lactiplantibacillus plantarum]WIR74291.1 alpha/beta hydrolase [Lactiplantibacillus plantarum]